MKSDICTMQDPRFSTVAFLRYRAVDELLQREAYPDVEELRQVIARVAPAGGEKEKVSRDLVVRILRSMRQEFDAPIRYSRRKNGYYYSDREFSFQDRPLQRQELSSLLMASQALSHATSNPVFEHLHSAVGKVADQMDQKDLMRKGEKQVMMIESAPKGLGTEYLADLLSAINDQRIVSIRYQRFGEQEPEPRTLIPLLLKQYKHRWYLLAQDYIKERVRTFGLDRIRGMEVSESKAPVTVSFDARTYFQHSIGITAFEGEPQHIRLKVDQLTRNYLESQPLHQSQKVQEHMGWVEVSLYLLPSEELIREILAMGPQVEVLSPESLREEVARRAREMAGLYRD